MGNILKTLLFVFILSILNLWFLKYVLDIQLENITVYLVIVISYIFVCLENINSKVNETVDNTSIFKNAIIGEVRKIEENEK